jgi:hypothetical protein
LPHGPSSGDGGAASDAVFANISVVAFDGAGNLYVVDGALVRRIRVDGTIATIAGGGAGPIQDGSAATGVNLSSVTAMTVDAAVDLYIGTRNFIRYVDSQTGVITTIAGNSNTAAATDGSGPNVFLGSAVTGFYLIRTARSGFPVRRPPHYSMGW